MRFNIVIEFIEFLIEVAYLLYIPQIFQFPILYDLVFDRHIAMISAFFIFLMTLTIDMPGNFVKIVFTSMRQIDVCVLLFSYFSLFLDS